MQQCRANQLHAVPTLDRCISDYTTLTHERCCKWGRTWLLTGDMRPSCSSSAHPSWHVHPQPHQQLSSHSAHTSQPSAGSVPGQARLRFTEGQAGGAWDGLGYTE